uniref:Phosphodiesterase n=1 Tax=Cryptococcus deneoformans TaxID=40410 RepID=Q3KVL8_9TREE|nr:high-affinity phosphodiesterase [Cryptococcus neoformans var. neoformans]
MGPRQGSSEAWNWARNEKRSSFSQRTSTSRESQNASRKGSTVSGIAFASADPFAAISTFATGSTNPAHVPAIANYANIQTPGNFPTACSTVHIPLSVLSSAIFLRFPSCSGSANARRLLLPFSRFTDIFCEPQIIQARRHTQAMRMTLGANTPSWQSSLVLCTATQGQLLIFKWRNLRSGYHESIDSRISANLLIRFSNPLTPKKRSQLVEPHYLHEDDLYRMACLIFEGILNIEGLAELLFAMRAIYHAPNPYHNYVHALDVLQATYTFLADLGVAPPFEYMREWGPNKEIWRRPSENEDERSAGTKRAREIMRPQDILAVLIAAMGHDVGHPGLSNAFMVSCPLSQVYEDKSVLENMHCMLVVQLLRKYGFGFLIERTKSSSGEQAVSNLDQKSFRQVLYSSILATDMSLHFAWVQRLKEFDDRLKSGEAGAVEDERILICQALIKCADISNPVSLIESTVRLSFDTHLQSRPIDVSQHWSSVLLEEWAKQASLEQDLSLPVSVVASADAALQAKGQIGFIDLFTKPLFQAVSDALPELQPYADSCMENQTIW